MKPAVRLAIGIVRFPRRCAKAEDRSSRTEPASTSFVGQRWLPVSDRRGAPHLARTSRCRPGSAPPTRARCRTYQHQLVHHRGHVRKVIRLNALAADPPLRARVRSAAAPRPPESVVRHGSTPRPLNRAAAVTRWSTDNRLAAPSQPARGSHASPKLAPARSSTRAARRGRPRRSRCTVSQRPLQQRSALPARRQTCAARPRGAGPPPDARPWPVCSLVGDDPGSGRRGRAAGHRPRQPAHLRHGQVDQRPDALRRDPLVIEKPPQHHTNLRVDGLHGLLRRRPLLQLQQHLRRRLLHPPVPRRPVLVQGRPTLPRLGHRLLPTCHLRRHLRSTPSPAAATPTAAAYARHTPPPSDATVGLNHHPDPAPLTHAAPPGLATNPSDMRPAALTPTQPRATSPPPTPEPAPRTNPTVDRASPSRPADHGTSHATPTATTLTAPPDPTPDPPRQIEDLRSDTPLATW